MMLEKIRYVNHLNEVIDFGENGIYVAKSDIHDYEWTASEKNGKISYFERKIRNRTLPVTILCNTPAEGIAARNRLMEVTEKDVIAMHPGRLLIGDYYYSCYINGSKKKNYLASRRLMEAELTIVSDAPFWVREMNHSFRKNQVGDEKYLDYPYDFSFDYASGFTSSLLTNTNFIGTNFRLIIYGPCKNPTVNIGGHSYGVTTDLADGEYLTIDSARKTIIKTAVNGAVSNIFNKRKRDSYVFELIPAGDSVVSWTGDYGVDIILLAERSEPLWT